MNHHARRCAASLVAVVIAAGAVLASAPSARADHVRDSQYWLQDYGITEAWKETKGEGVTVAVIDTGVDAAHPDITGAVVGGLDVSGSGAAGGTEPIGALPEHGTLVSTMLAGHGNNKEAVARAKAESQQQEIAWKRAVAEAKKNKESPPAKPEPISVPKPGAGPDGMIGVAPKAELLTVSLWLGSENPSGVDVEDQVPRAVKWAVDQGAQVINMSLGSTRPDWPASWDDAFLYAEQHDVVVVAAAGNRAGGMVQVGAPATIPGVLTVAGVDEQRQASFDSSTQGISIGVAAPADPLIGGLPGGGYADWSGTSGAAPLVSGVAALIRSKYPEMSAPQVINRILATAEDAGAPGPDNLYGYGLMNAAAAVSADVPAVEANPLGTIAEWIRIHRRGKAELPTQAPTATPHAESTVPPVAAPAAVAPDSPGGALPAALVIGFGALLLLVSGIGAVRVARVRRATGAGSVDDGTLAQHEWGGADKRRDPFDDLPEGR